MTIRIFVIGGTFDKEYNELTGELFFKNSHISEMLTLGRSRVPVDIRTLMMVDSTTIMDEDREIIAINCKKAQEDRILITHGTDTMVQTTKKLADIQEKTIVLTGALKPALFKTTDAVFNIGCAVTAVQTLQSGIYVVMNGCVFTYDNVRKNVQHGMFESL